MNALKMIGGWGRRVMVAGVAAAAFWAGGGAVLAQYRPDIVDYGTPRAVENAAIVAKPGSALPMSADFTTSAGNKVKLGDLFGHGRPVIVSLVYFSCPNLCGLTQDSLANTVHEGPRDLKIGQDYDIVVVSIDPDDSVAAAATKKSHYLDLMRKPADQAGLTYLIGTKENIASLADAVGFPYHRNFPDQLDTSGKFAHDSGIFICTPYGQLSQTILGAQFDPDQVHYSLREAAGGKIGSGFLDTVALPCGAMRFNPNTGKYETNPWFWVGTAGGLASMAFVGTFLAVLWRGEFKKKKSEAGGGIKPGLTG